MKLIDKLKNKNNLLNISKERANFIVDSQVKYVTKSSIPVSGLVAEPKQPAKVYGNNKKWQKNEKEIKIFEESDYFYYFPWSVYF